MDEREAFCRAVTLYRFDDWKPGAPDPPRLDVKGNSCTIEQTCELVAGIADQLPDDVVGDLAAAFYRGPNTDLAAAFGKDRSSRRAAVACSSCSSAAWQSINSGKRADFAEVAVRLETPTNELLS